MFQWLSTIGAPLKDPLPGSTNYLGAYNKNGQLTRVVLAAKKSGKEKDEEPQQNESEPPNNTENENGVKAADLPPETTRDLAPFPLNRTFMSQPVLSSEFQRHIWKQVILHGRSVREVSAKVSVEMSRVAAVVRLVEIENEWMRMVRIFSSFSSTVSNDFMMIF